MRKNPAKKLLLLGGSLQQIPALVTARKMGYKTVLCDYLPDNPGRQYADHYHCISTVDREAVLQIAEQEKIHGILAYATDPAAATAAYVAEKLGLPGHPLESVEILTNKERFRKFLRLHGFHTPKAKGYSCVEEACKDLAGFKLPVLVKPVDSSGSKGVSILFSAEGLEEKARYALSFSRLKRFLMEAYVELEGYQVAGDGFSVDGKLIYRCFGNDHFDLHNPNPFVPVAASFPIDRPEAVQDKSHDEIQRLLTLLKMKNGAYNFDIRIDQKGNVCLMEVGPRNGGNYIPQVIRCASEGMCDPVCHSIMAAAGEDLSGIRMPTIKGFWSYYAVHSKEAGVLREIRIEEKVRENNIAESHMNFRIGEHVPVFTASNQAIGILLMRFASMEEMLTMMDHPETWINVMVEQVKV